MGLLLAALAIVYNAQLTPGAVALDAHGQPLTRDYVCAVKWGKDARHVDEKMKRAVAAAYGLPRSSIVARGKGPCCEIDHFFSRELGGADDVRNLWPQPWAEAVLKDQDENRLHRAVCAPGSTLTLEQARDELKRKWGH